MRFGDYMNSIPLPAVLSVFKAEEWENFGLATIDSSLIYSMVDVLLGGRRGQSSLRIEGRPYTSIETNLVKRLVEVVLADAEQGYGALAGDLLDRTVGTNRDSPHQPAANAAIRCACASTWKHAAAIANCCCLRDIETIGPC